MRSEFLLSTLFLNWPRRLNLFKKARFLENLCKKLWNLDNTSRSNLVKSCSYYSFCVPRKLYRKTSGSVATQLLSSVVNRILNDTQRSAGQFFLNRLYVCGRRSTWSASLSEIGRYFSWLLLCDRACPAQPPAFFLSRVLLLGFGKLLSIKKKCHCRF